MSDRQKEHLEEGLSEVLADTDAIIENITLNAGILGVDPYTMRNPDGTYAMAPLLLAKSTALAALVALRD